VVSKKSVPWDLGRGTKRTLPGSRVCSAEETELGLRSVLGRVPVTRVSDLTPLDRLGLPVFTAVTPFARDLTTHMGKGADAVSAKVSACMEAIERLSAETAGTAATVRGSFASLQQGEGPIAVDPRLFTLPDDSRYAPDREFTWVESHELISGKRFWIAADLVLNPPSEGILHDVDTNGLAAGNTYLEAVVHALCEIIERDVQSQLEFVSLFGDPLDQRPDMTSLDLRSATGVTAHWIERVRSNGLDLIVHNVTNDLGVTTFVALLTDYDYPTRSGTVTMHFAGWGTAPDARLALQRAVTEAVQSRLGMIQAARDTFNTSQLELRAAARGHRRRLLQDGSRAALSDFPSVSNADLREDLRFLQERLAANGLEQVFVTDLARPDLGIPVVRVRVPGLATFSINRRRVGWRCMRHLL
jgi:ribosomal protein S12 methylthiotransferase accessory factor